MRRFRRADDKFRVPHSVLDGIDSFYCPPYTYCPCVKVDIFPLQSADFTYPHPGGQTHIDSEILKRRLLLQMPKQPPVVFYIKDFHS